MRYSEQYLATTDHPPWPIVEFLVLIIVVILGGYASYQIIKTLVVDPFAGTPTSELRSEFGGYRECLLDTKCKMSNDDWARYHYLHKELEARNQPQSRESRDE